MIEWINRHPNVTTWIALAIGMLAALLWSARDEGLAALQWAWLAFAVTCVAGLCAWIISWEADVEDEYEGDGALSHESDDTARTVDGANAARSERNATSVSAPNKSAGVDA